MKHSFWYKVMNWSSIIACFAMIALWTGMRNPDEDPQWIGIVLITLGISFSLFVILGIMVYFLGWISPYVMDTRFVESRNTKEDRE